MEISNVVQASPYLSGKQLKSDHNILALKKQDENARIEANNNLRLIESVPKVQADGQLGTKFDGFA